MGIFPVSSMGARNRVQCDYQITVRPTEPFFAACPNSTHFSVPFLLYLTLIFPEAAQYNGKWPGLEIRAGQNFGGFLKIFFWLKNAAMGQWKHFVALPNCFSWGKKP